MADSYAAPASAEAAARLADSLAFNADGLVPAIAQEVETGEVLMLAWQDRQALEATLTTGEVTYYSRSRGKLWRKGESSGNRQYLVELRLDCDSDTVLLLVSQLGPACHTGRRSCFYRAARDGTLATLQAPD